MLGLPTATARRRAGRRLAAGSSLAAARAAAGSPTAAAAAARAAAEGGAQRADLQVREGDRRVGAVGLDVRRRARRRGAAAAGRAGLGRGGRVRAVEPEHVDRVVVPDGEHEHLPAGHGLAHGGQAALRREGVGVAEGGLLRVAPRVAHVVLSGHAGNVGLGVGDHLAVLHVEALDFREGAAGGPVGRDELSDDRDGLGCVDGHAGAVECGVAHTVGVEVAAVLVADSIISLACRDIATLNTGASSLAGDGARMRCVCLGDLVGLPDVELRATSAIHAGTSVHIIA